MCTHIVKGKFAVFLIFFLLYHKSSICLILGRFRVSIMALRYRLSDTPSFLASFSIWDFVFFGTRGRRLTSSLPATSLRFPDRSGRVLSMLNFFISGVYNISAHCQAFVVYLIRFHLLLVAFYDLPQNPSWRTHRLFPDLLL